MREWNWPTGGVALASVVVLAMLSVKPIGVSTQYVVTDAMIWNLFDDSLIEVTVNHDTGGKSYTSPNAYLNKSDGKYAKAAANPANYGYVFVLSMIGGAALSMLLGGPRTSATHVAQPPAGWEASVVDADVKRYLIVLASGFLVLFGARLAGGCTSGHMISGITQTAVSGYLFTVAVFLSAIPTALIAYRPRGQSR